MAQTRTGPSPEYPDDFPGVAALATLHILGAGLRAVSGRIYEAPFSLRIQFWPQGVFFLLPLYLSVPL